MKKYIERAIKDVLLELSSAYPVIILTGPRQVGKSTLLNAVSKESNKQINYVTFDDLRVRMLAQEDPELFLETYRAPLIIDEFQYVPNLLSYIKIIVDQNRLNSFDNDLESNGLYYLTGSQLFHATKNVSESLAGRVGILELNGLSRRETLSEESKVFIPDVNNISLTEKKDTIQDIFKRIFRGNFPELHANVLMDCTKFYDSYISTYIEKDIRSLINIKDELKFMKFIQSVAVRTGCELVYDSICDDVSISINTAKEWLSILKSTGLVYLLEPTSNNVRTRIVKRPKIYFMDTGLACNLAGYNSPETLERSAFNGQIFETYIITEIIKSYLNSGKSPSKHLSYYRDSNGKEIDLIIDIDNIIYPIEIKKSKNPGKEALKNFSILSKFTGTIAKGSVICLSDSVFPIDKDNYIIPIEAI